MVPSKIKKEVVISPNMEGATYQEKLDSLTGLFKALTHAIDNGCQVDISDSQNIRVSKEV